MWTFAAIRNDNQGEVDIINVNKNAHMMPQSTTHWFQTFSDVLALLIKTLVLPTGLFIPGSGKSELNVFGSQSISAQSKQLVCAHPKVSPSRDWIPPSRLPPHTHTEWQNSKRLDRSWFKQGMAEILLKSETFWTQILVIRGRSSSEVSQKATLANAVVSNVFQSAIRNTILLSRLKLTGVD